MALMYEEFHQQLPRHLPVTETERGDRVSVHSKDDVQAVVQVANETRTPIAPDFGQTVPAPDRMLIDVAHLNGVTSYRTEEFLITAETGMTVGQLMETLDAQDQRMAHLYSRSRRLMDLLGEETLSLSETRHGALRHWVTGIEAVTGDGQRIHYGGEVVKNVTGYDLNKLFLGSQHRYGLLTSVILKVLPKPEMSRTFLFHVEDLNQALELLVKLSRMLPNPEVLTLFRTKTTFGWQILVILSGYRDVVHTESDAVHEAISHLNTDLQELFLAPRAVDQWIQRLDWTHAEEPDALVLRVALGHKALMDFPYRFLGQSWLKTADVLMPVQANHLLLRWISVNVPQEKDLNAFKEQIEELGGFVEITRTPPHWPLDDVRFNQDPQPVIQSWTRRLKDQFDPNGVLPGMSLSPQEVGR
jgi:hypothetical protein